MRPILALPLLFAALAPVAAFAQQTTSYVVRLGADTLSLEQVTRTPQQIRGEYVVRTPRSLDRSYLMDLRPDGTVRRFELVTRTLGASSGPENRATIEFTADSAIVVFPRGDSTATHRVATGGNAVPSLNGVMGLMEQIARQARGAGGSSYSLALVAPGANQPLRATVVPTGGDSLRLDIVTSVGPIPPFILTLDRNGRLSSFSGKGGVFQAEAERVPSVDLAAARAAYGGRPLGQLSSRDTARAMVGDAALWVDYGRPSKRGREVFGNVVPWNVVWRTGANAATQFQTPVDLVIGDAAVPAGTYSLWTLPTPGGWKLIINRQTGQWGTQYDPAQDLARVDLTVETREPPIERFTILIEPDGARGTLHLTWDRTHLMVPIRVKG